MEFLAEDEMVEIVPNMRMEPLNFISVCMIPLVNSHKKNFIFAHDPVFIFFSPGNDRGILVLLDRKYQLKCRFGLPFP